MIYVVAIALGFLGIRFTVALVNLLSRPYLYKREPQEQPLVSILIPARNEAENIAATLHSLQALPYPHLEIWVLDDGSEDDTLAIVSRMAKTDSRIQVIQGRPLPEGWLGKNWACHQLAAKARGEFFLFIDADVTLSPGAIAGGLAEMQERNLSLLSIFPDQYMHSTGEKLVVPLMHHLLLSLLPLRLVTSSPNPAFAAANGQYMLFDREGYQENQWHQLVRSAIVEDIEIMKSVKRAGLSGRVLLGNGLVHCRMYHNFHQGWRGFSKNLLAGFNHSIPGMMVYLFLIAGAWCFLPFVPLWMTGVFLALTLGLRVMISLLGNQSVGANLILHPLQMLIWVGIGIRSAWVRLRGTNEWKGRNIDLKKTKKPSPTLTSQRT